MCQHGESDDPLVLKNIFPKRERSIRTGYIINNVKKCNEDRAKPMSNACMLQSFVTNVLCDCRFDVIPLSAGMSE